VARVQVPGGHLGPEERAVTLAVDDSTGALSVRVGDILSDGGLRDALHSGLPLRILFEVELW